MNARMVITLTASLVVATGLLVMVATDTSAQTSCASVTASASNQPVGSGSNNTCTQPIAWNLNAPS